MGGKRGGQESLTLEIILELPPRLALPAHSYGIFAVHTDDINVDLGRCLCYLTLIIR